MASTSDDAKTRFGMLAGIISTLLLIGAIMGFLSGHETYELFDLGPDANVMDWYALVMSMLFGGVALALGVLISSSD